MKAPISLCIIVKNEPLLENCLKSLRDYVEEIVIVDTGSTDGITPQIAQKYANIFEVYTACNDPTTGLINDFSQARQRSFDLATQQWVMWCDADDVVEGGQNLIKLIEEFEKNKNGIDAVSYLFPYEYAYNGAGQCVLQHYRERIFSNKKCFHWVNPVHEVVVPNDGLKIALLQREELVFKHHRQFSPKPGEPGRNLRILRKYYEKVGDTDARQLYYLGLECCNAGFVDEAIQHLIKYVDVSGWEDERVMACLKLVEIFQSRGKLDEGIKWAFKAIEIKEDWAEGYFALSKMFYFMASNGGPNETRNWQKCIYFGKEGLKLPPTKTLLFINPLERECEIHKYLNLAYNKVGDVKNALISVVVGMEKQPDDPHFLNNRRLYEDFLARQQIVENANILKKNKSIEQSAVEMISAIINNQPIAGFQPVEEVCDIPEQPTEVLKNDNPLDIVFFAGDGVEVWTPQTVKKTGIGGSELMLLEQARRLVRLGHKVRVYNSCGAGAKTYEGVEYHQTKEFQDLECDVLIVSRRADMLGDQYNIQAKLKLLWVHDIFAIAATNELLLKADKILALSEWHKQFLISYHNIHPSHVTVTRNGIDLTRFDGQFARNRFKCVNSSSPDRSWPILLEVWPKIKQQVPQAELHLYYGFKNWEYSAQFDPKQMELIRYLQQKIKDMASLGVVYHDRVNQKQLAEEFLGAGCWTYPTWFSETSCITAMEVQASGLRMVTSNIAALKETAGSRATLLDGEWTSPEYQQKFIDGVVSALNNTDDADRLQLQEYAKENFGLDTLAQDWEQMFYKLMEDLKTKPLVPYYPTNQYRGSNDLYLSDIRSPNKLLPKSTNIISKKTPKISIIIPTNRIGGLDILFESLSKQIFQDFELVLVDAIHDRRKNIVAEKSKLYNFPVKHVSPLDNTFPVSNYCKSMNTGLCAAEGELIYFTCDYAYLDKNILQTHTQFHSNTPKNYMLMLPVNECHFDKKYLSKKFPMERQYGTRGLDAQYQLLVAPEEHYVGSHNTWSENYAEDIKKGLLDDVLWSIFEEPIEENTITRIISKLTADTKLINVSKETPQQVMQDLCCLKNDSFKREFLIEANGMDEEMDGSHGFQDSELARRLKQLYNGQFFAMYKHPVSVINTRYYLEPRKIIKGYNNIKIIDRKYLQQEPLQNNTITKFKESKVNEI